MQVTIQTDDPRPIYQQIVDEVRRALVVGTLGPEEEERRALALDVSRRALVDAHRNGLGVEELMDALEEVSWEPSAPTAPIDEGEEP